MSDMACGELEKRRQKQKKPEEEGCNKHVIMQGILTLFEKESVFVCKVFKRDLETKVTIPGLYLV